MRWISKLLFTTALILSLSSCSTNVEPEGILASGINLSQLAEPKTDLSANTDFTAIIGVIKIGISPGKFDFLAELRDGLNVPQLNEGNLETLQKNGVSVVSGNLDLLNTLLGGLDSLNVKIIRSINLIIYDSSGDLVELNKLQEPLNAFYTDSDGSLIGKTIAGKVRADILLEKAKVNDKLKLTFAPYFTKGKENYFRKYIDGKLPDGANSSDAKEDMNFLKFAMNVSSGDFILISPQVYPFEDFSVSEAMFPILQDSADMQIYLIICKQLTVN